MRGILISKLLCITRFTIVVHLSREEVRLDRSKALSCVPSVPSKGTLRLELSHTVPL